jgi:hypothetical protein
MFEGRLATLGGLVAAAVLGVSLPACAEPMFRNFAPCGENRGTANPPVGRYVATLGGRTFIFDRVTAAPEALLKFEDEAEVWVLEPSPAPGGGKTYRNDAGERMLSVSCLGGMTLFTPREPDGLPVSIQGEADELLPLPVMPTDAMQLRGLQAAIRAERAVQSAIGVARASQRQINFSTSQMRPQWRPIFVESFDIAADAIVKLSHDKKAKAFLAKLDSVQFTAGAKPDVSISGSVMTITLAPNMGFAGRPSSNRIMKICLKH